jgi:hypothetical protein
MLTDRFFVPVYVVRVGVALVGVFEDAALATLALDFLGGGFYHINYT